MARYQGAHHPGRQVDLPPGENSNIYNMAFVGHERFMEKEMKAFFSDRTLTTISQKITEHLRGVHPDGKNIVVHPQVLRDLMNAIYINNRGPPKDMMNQVIANAVATIRDEFEINANNKKLNKDVVKLDEDPRWMMRRADIVKVNENPINRLNFNFNY